MLNYYHTEPKKFKGGEIILSSYNNQKKATIEVKNNRCVLITSNTWHEVAKLESEIDMPKYSGDGRYCCSIFLSRIDDKQWVQDPNGGGKYVERNDVGQYSADKVGQK
jgi:Rps23 Pro-64 3,4-dihydroxylase Tpa1-like proline 4-hydroxylase